MRHALGSALMVAALGAAAGPPAALGDPNCPNGDLAPSSDNLAQVAGALVCEMNQRRAAAGLPALKGSVQLSSSARYQVEDMAFFRYFAHQREGGPSVLTRIRATGYFDNVAGGVYTENLADAPEGRESAADVVEAWMESDHHRANMLTP